MEWAREFKSNVIAIIYVYILLDVSSIYYSYNQVRNSVKKISIAVYGSYYNWIRSWVASVVEFPMFDIEVLLCIGFTSLRHLYSALSAPNGLVQAPWKPFIKVNHWLANMPELHRPFLHFSSIESAHRNVNERPRLSPGKYTIKPIASQLKKGQRTW